jgi:predicted anti-sigma-YlaC factor YlaD
VCPDAEILSAYFDGELTGYWAEKIENHVAGCLSCRQALDSLGNLRDNLMEIQDPDPRESMDRVWQRLAVSRESMAFQRGPVWTRRISLPFPIVALAASVIMVLGFIVAISMARGGTGIMKITTEPSGVTEVQVSAPVKDLEALLRSFDMQDGRRDEVILLPEDSRFIIFGESVLLKEEEYSRGSMR